MIEKFAASESRDPPRMQHCRKLSIGEILASRSFPDRRKSLSIRHRRKNRSQLLSPRNGVGGCVGGLTQAARHPGRKGKNFGPPQIGDSVRPACLQLLESFNNSNIQFRFIRLHCNPDLYTFCGIKGYCWRHRPFDKPARTYTRVKM